MKNIIIRKSYLFIGTLFYCSFAYGMNEKNFKGVNKLNTILKKSKIYNSQTINPSELSIQQSVYNIPKQNEQFIIDPSKSSVQQSVYDYRNKQNNEQLKKKSLIHPLQLEIEESVYDYGIKQNNYQLKEKPPIDLSKLSIQKSICGDASKKHDKSNTWQLRMQESIYEQDKQKSESSSLPSQIIIHQSQENLQKSSQKESFMQKLSSSKNQKLPSSKKVIAFKPEQRNDNDDNYGINEDEVPTSYRKKGDCRGGLMYDETRLFNILNKKEDNFKDLLSKNNDEQQNKIKTMSQLNKNNKK